MENSLEYIVMAKVKHFNKSFLMLFNKINGIYFLEATDTGYEHPTLEEFIKLKKIYNPFRMNTYYQKMNVNPLVKIKNQLVSAILVSTMLFSMSGCSNKDSAPAESTIKDLINSGISVSDGLIEGDNIYFITGIDFENPKTEQFYGEVDPALKYSYNETVTINEFAERLDIKNKTYDDIFEVLKANSNIDDSIKLILEEGLNNLKDSNFDINLGLLYYNLKDLNIVYSDSLIANGAIAVFNENNREVSILKNANQTENIEEYKTILTHEIIGHGLTSAYSKDLKILCGPEALMLITDTSGKITTSTGFGNAFKEGLTELITAQALNKKMTCPDFYSTEAYTVKLLSELYDIPLSEMADIGIEKLASKLTDKGLKDSIVLFEALDEGMYGKMNNSLEEDFVTTENTMTVLANYISQQYNNGKNPEEIKDKINNVFDNMRNFFEYETYEGTGEILYGAASDNCFTYLGVEYIHQNSLQICDQLKEGNIKR